MRTTKILSWYSLASGIFLVVLGFRWAVIGKFGIDLPKLDQWDAEGLHLLLPWFQGRPFLPELFTSHNEHYPVLTKLLNLALTLVNGQWDQRLECVVNAVLPAGIAVALFGWAQTFLKSAAALATAVILAALWSLPLGWENIISGFHSQQFFLIGLSFAAIALLPFTQAWSLRWWIGVGCALLALLSMASGLFAAAIVIAVVVVRHCSGEDRLLRRWPTLIVMLALCVLGWMVRPEVPYHAFLKAQNARDFLVTAARSLQWPVPFSSWSALLVWAPWVALILSLFRGRDSAPHRICGWALLGLGLWVWLQIAAAAYARGAGGPAPASRYVDNLVFGCCVNVLALGWLDAGQNSRSSDRRIIWIVALAWLAIVASSLFVLSQRAITSDLPNMGRHHRNATAHTRAYLATRDRANLASIDIPYPGADAFVERLEHRELLDVLPASVRAAIPIEAAPESSPFTPTPPHSLESPTNAERGNDSTPFGIAAPGFRRTWSSQTLPATSRKEVWTSAPVHPSGGAGRLVFAVAGSPNAPGMKLQLREALTGRVIANLQSSPTREGEWNAAFTRQPAVTFVVYAEDASADHWLAFSEPVVMANGSYAAWWLAERGAFIAFSGVAAMLLSAAGIVAATRFPITPRPASPQACAA